MKKQVVGLKRIVVAVALAIGSQNASALGLGKLNVESTLGEPLNAHIPFTSITDKEKKKLVVGLAPRKDFEAAGLDYPEFLSSLKVKVVDDGGVKQLVISTHKPLREPVVHLLLKVDWAEGRLIREYTALLDPPVFKDKQQFDKSASIVAPSSNSASSGKAPAASVAKKSNQASRNPTAQAASNSPDTYGPVREGETLWSITEDSYGVSDARLLQAMMAVLDQNPRAFIKHNVHGLLAGKTLKLPPLAEATRVSPKQAYREFVAQTEQWKSVVQSSDSVPQLAGTEISTSVESSQAANASEKNTGAAAQAKVEKTSPAKTTPADTGEGKLEIIVADDKSVSGEAVPEGSAQSDAVSSKLKKRVAVLEEALSSKESESKELLTRVQLLEEQLNKARKLIQIQNAELSRIQAQMQAQLKNGAPADAAAATQMAEAAAAMQAGEDASAQAQDGEDAQTADAESAPVEESSDPVSPVVASQEQSGNAADRPMFEERAAAEKTASAGDADSADNADESPADAEGETARPRIVAGGGSVGEGASGLLDKAKDMFASVSSGSYFLPLLGGLALGGLGLLFVRRRRSVAEFEESILATSTFETQSDFGASIDETRAETTFLNDFGADADQADLEDVDPITEAEVYLAYGRVDQAAEILEDAIKKDPDRQELKLKLLEVFSQKGDVKSFETLAEEMYSVSGSDAEIWDKVSAMGREISPANPLFASTGAQSAKPDGGEKLAAAEADTSPEPAQNATPVAPTQETPDEPVERAELAEPVKSVEASDITGAGKQASSPFASMDFGEEEPVAAADTPTATEPAFSEPETAPSVPESSVAEAAPANPLDIPSFGDSMDFTQTYDAPASESATESLADIKSMDDGLSMQPETGSIAAGEPESAQEPDQIIQDQIAQGQATQAASAQSDVLDFDSEIPVFNEFGDTDLSDGMLGDNVGDAGDWDENTTKLDLAKAYIDMGDGDGARSILGEVLNQGSEEQKQQASELMAQAS